MTSDYDLGGGRRAPAGGGRKGVEAAKAPHGASAGAHGPSAPSSAAHPGAQEARGLGGNTRGSEGYGEITEGSLRRLCCLLANLRRTLLENLHFAWPSVWDLSCESSLVDVGSGYGKAVIHFALEANLRRSVGIECVASRHEIAEESLQELKLELLLDPSLSSRDSKGLVRDGRRQPSSPPSEMSEEQQGPDAENEQSNGDEKGQVGGGRGAMSGARNVVLDTAVTPAEKTPAEKTPAQETPTPAEESPTPAAASLTPFEPFSAVQFHFGDATRGARLDYTHVYAFDRVFSPITQRALAAILMESPFYVLVSYRNCVEWWNAGLTIVQPVGKMTLKTTGKETMNVYVYINMRRIPNAGSSGSKQA